MNGQSYEVIALMIAKWWLFSKTHVTTCFIYCTCSSAFAALSSAAQFFLQTRLTLFVTHLFVPLSKMVSYDALIFNIFNNILSALLLNRGEVPNSGARISFKDVVEWIQTDPNAPSNEAVQQLFRQQEISGLDDPNFKKKIDTKYLDQGFRALMACRVGFPKDRRTWDYAVALPGTYRKTNMWISTFFMSVQAVRRRKDKPAFHTSIATPFERLLFVMASKVIGDEKVAAGSGEPRRKKRRTDTQRLPAFKWTREGAQRIGYAVQTVVRAWDLFAQSLRFPNVDSMISPYILYMSASHKFVPLKARQDGYAPLSQRETLIGIEGATTDQGQCDPIAFDREDTVDNALRSLAGSFMEDYRRILLHNTLYTMKPGDDFDELRAFHPRETRPGKVPSRFDSFDVTALRQARDEVPLVAVPSSGQPFPSSYAGKTTVPGSTALLTPKTSRRLPEVVNLESDDEDDITPATPQPPQPLEAPQPEEVKLEEQPEVEVEDVPQAVVCSGGEGCVCHPARARLLQEMEAFARLYECSFEDLIDTDGLCSRFGSIEEEVQLVLTDPPFNHRRESNRPNSDHDRLSDEQMSKATEVMTELLGEGGHAIVFCCPLQFHKWYGLFHSANRRRAFNVDPFPLSTVNRPGHFFGYVRRKTTALFSIQSWALHATKTGLTNEEAFKLVDYSNHNYVPSRHPAWTNVMDEVGRLRPGEAVRGKNGDGRWANLRPEQKSRDLLKELISRFTQPGALVVDMFAGTFSTAAACLSLPKHRKFVGCEKYGNVFEAGRARLVEIFAAAILDPRSDIVFTDDGILRDARLVVEHSDGNGATDPDWTPPKGFPGFQTLPKPLLQFLGCLWKVPTLSTKFDGVPVSRWPTELKGHLQSTPMEVMTSIDGSTSGLCLGKSTVKHFEAGNGVFAMRKFRVGEVVGFYYGCIVFDDLSARSQVTKRYGEEGCLGVTVREFRKYQVEVNLYSTGIVIGNQTVTKAFIVPAEFCICREINDPRYLQEDEEFLTSRLDHNSRRKANVKLTTLRVRYVLELVPHTLVKVECIRDIAEGEELFLDYGPNYF